MSAYIKSIADVPQVDLNNLPRFKTNIPELDKCIGGLLFGTVTSNRSGSENICVQRRVG